MRKFGPVLCVLVTATGIVAAQAQERPFTPSLSCASVKAIVLRDHSVDLATSQYAYELVHADSMGCASDETSVPAFEPTADDPHCLAGWRCRQHNSDGNR